MSRRRPEWLLLMVPLIAAAAVRGFWAPDEPRYAQVARETWEGSGWLVLRLCGEVYPDKPPLLYWLAGLLDRLSGGSEFVMRIPSLAATAISAWLVSCLARRWWGDREGRMAPWLYLTFAMVAEIGGRLQLDPLLACFILGALTLVPFEGDARPRLRMALAGLSVGLGVLTKGPVALWIVVLVVLAWSVRPADGPRPRTKGWAWGLVLALLPAVAWAASASWAEPSLARELFFGQHAGRAISSTAPHAGPIWKHALRLPSLLLPWTPVVLAAAWAAARTGRRDRGETLAWRWFLALFLFFSLIPPKRDLYLLPAYPALALIGARHIVRGVDGTAVFARWVPASVMGILGALAVASISMPLWPERWMGAASGHVPGIGWRAPLVGSVLAVALLTVHRRVRRGDRLGWARGIGIATATAYTAGALLLVAPLDATKSPCGLAERLVSRAERPLTVPCLGVRPEGYRFYSGLPTIAEGLDEALARAGDVLALVERHRFAALPDEQRSALQVVHRVAVGSRDVLVCIRAERELPSR
jgi:4-amino-4-deoxy-L-arabinose transferase-like glycosyltransferase